MRNVQEINGLLTSFRWIRDLKNRLRGDVLVYVAQESVFWTACPACAGTQIRQIAHQLLLGSRSKERIDAEIAQKGRLLTSFRWIRDLKNRFRTETN